MRVIYFTIAVISMVVAIGLSMGEIQKYVKFNSVDSEIILFMMLVTCSLLFLTFSIQEYENED